VIAVTADHGMNAKHDSRGLPDVIYLAEELDHILGPGQSRVILPITDPYVVHHGALGSYAVIYLEGDDWQPVADLVSKFDGIDLVLDRETAATRFELPPDRLGDLVVISTANKVLGTRERDHDLSGLNQPLRSHGGLSEQRVPLLVNRPCDIPEGACLRNFDAFDLALNRLREVGP
jgi:phosphonoacetate hydrolase